MGEPRSWGEFTAELVKLIGQEADTGGSQTEGTVFAKENAILEVLKNGGLPIVKSIQRSSVSTSDNYKTITISKVNPLKTIVLVNGGISFSGGGNAGMPVYVGGLTETSVTITGITNGGIDASIQVVEFY